jgi:hypothetical protein
MVLAPEKNFTLVVPGVDTVEDESPPSLDFIQTLKKDYQQYYRAFHDLCSKVEDYYFGRKDVPAPEGFDAVRTARARAIINTASSHVDVNNVAIEVPPASPRAKARAERIQKFYQGVWLTVKAPVKQEAVRHAFAFGVSWFKVMFESERWPDAPIIDHFDSDKSYRDALEDFLEKRNVSFPIVVDTVHPKRLLWDDGRTGPKWVIEFYERSTDQIQRRYPQWQPLTEGQNGMHSWMEYWDEKWAVYIADGAVVWAAPHGYGFLPYIPVLPANSLSWNDGKPEERYQGLYSGIFDLLDEHARTITQHSALLRQSAWRTLDFVGPANIAEQTASNYEMFGSKNVVPNSVEVKASPSVPLPPEILNHLSMLETNIEEATFPNVIRGVRPRGVSTGFAISVLAGMGRLVFQGVADGMARALEECNSGFARLVENKLRGRITVHARSDIHNFDQTVGPDDIRGYYENKVGLKAESPEERERESLLALRLWNNGNGLISEEEAMRRAGVVSPLEMQVQKQAEALLRSPLMLQTMQQLAAERLGLLQQLAQAVSQTGGAGGANNGQFVPGLSQLQNPGQTFAQGARVENQASVYPKGFGGLDALGSILGTPTGGAQGMPSGQTVR